MRPKLGEVSPNGLQIPPESFSHSVVTTRLIGGYQLARILTFRNGSKNQIPGIWRNLKFGDIVYSPYPRRLESLNICRWNWKGSTFSSVILRPWMMFRRESNSGPPAWQPEAQPIEPQVLEWGEILCFPKRDPVSHLNDLQSNIVNCLLRGMKGLEAHIIMRGDAQPACKKARRVPYAL